jgi:hypothetical protein
VVLLKNQNFIFPFSLGKKSNNLLISKKMCSKKALV